MLHERRWTRQPQCEVTLEDGHPLASGMIFSAYNAAPDMRVAPRDYVSGRLGSLTGCTLLPTNIPPSNEPAVAFSCNGTSSDAIQTTIDLNPYRTISLACWLWWNTNGTDNACALRYTNATTNIGWAIQPNFNASGTGKLGINVWNNNSFYQVTTTQPSAGAWHHIGTTIDLTAATKVDTIYVDGQPLAPSTFANAFVGTTSSFTANQPLYIMQNPATPGFSAGRIMNIAIWYGRLGAARARALYLRPWDMFAPYANFEFPTPVASTTPAYGWFLGA